MNTTDLKWLIGIAVTVQLAIGGALIAAFRSLSAKIDRTDGALDGKLDREVAQLHDRVNRIRDEYVKRVDLDGHLSRIDGTLKEIQADQKEVNRHVIGALQAVAMRQDRATNAAA